MKKLSTISLFIFGVITTAILVAGLVFYQNNKNQNILKSEVPFGQMNNTIQNFSDGKVNPVQTSTSQNKVDTLKNSPVKTSSTGLSLNMSEISKHNNSNDCWMLISSKVYNITSYFGSHPGGNKVMETTCGTDATAAYMTQDPNATSSRGQSAHSSRATSMLANYYLGDFNQQIIQ